jgi:hypothetical protein
MTSAPKRRWFAFSLRTLFVTVTLVAILAALLVRSWHHTRTRLEYVAKAGAVNGHARTMQGYSNRANRWKLGGLLFGDRDVEKIWLYPATYSDADLAYLRSLFPEAIITDYDPESTE